jgi:predicted phosphodiesterase
MRLTITLLLALSSSVLAGSDFAFVILSDRTGSNVDGIHEQIILKSLSEDVELYVSVGDHIEGYGSDNDFTNAEWDEYLSIVKPIKTDLYFTPGNHDIWDDESEAIWRDRIGREPNYSFDYEGVHFVIFDTSRWHSSDELPEDYIEWLETDLAAHKEDRLTFVLFHKPLWYETVPEGNENILHELFKEYGVD